MSYAAAAALSAFTSDADALAPRVDLAERAEEFERDGLALIPALLDDERAQRWLAHIANWREWALVTRVEGRHRNFDAAAMEQVEATRRIALDELIATEARAGFQYLYERYPLDDLARAGRLHDPVMCQMHALLRSAAFLDFARALTGMPHITHADGQVTRYRRGHFLTLHDDFAEGRQRVAAFVLNLTPSWAADFGGQLQFVDARGEIEHSIAPRFNRLVVFRVPRPHLVSAVANFVDEARYAITGWFHTGPEPAHTPVHDAAQR